MSLKIFISDIHLSDTTTGKHNIKLKTLEGFWNDIKKILPKPEVSELIVLGDFIDVIRSTKWNGDIQPWKNTGDIKNVVKGIVEKVYEENKSVFDKLNEYVQGGLI